MPVGSATLDDIEGLIGMLADWLPRQRWFPGRGQASDLAIVSDVMLLGGDPALRHLIVETPLRGGTGRFQVLVGYRAELPASLAGALIGHVRGVACYDALHDPELAEVLLLGIGEQRTAGHLRFIREPAAPALTGPERAGRVPAVGTPAVGTPAVGTPAVGTPAVGAPAVGAPAVGAPAGREPGGPEPAGSEPGAGEPTGRVLGGEQSNTSLVFGEHAILKVLRRLFPGANPDLEVADALARIGSARVAAPYGWIEADIDAQPVLLAVLSHFLAGADNGWTLALADLGRLYARHEQGRLENLPGPAGEATPAAGPTVPAPTAMPAPTTVPAPRAAARARAAGATQPPYVPFADEAHLLGQATAELHADMAKAFGSRDMTQAELTTMVAELAAKLSEAVAVVPELRSHAGRISAAFDAVAHLDGPVSIQRIHGDYHLGQVLRSRQGWVALDFEGEPAVPLAQRRAPAPALRDVAGMLRSFDYAARHQLVGHPDAGRVAGVASAWVQHCQAAFCAGYAERGGIDPDGHGALLRALMLEKAVYEVVYEYRHRPSWLSIPLDFVAAA